MIMNEPVTLSADSQQVFDRIVAALRTKPTMMSMFHFAGTPRSASLTQTVASLTNLFTGGSQHCASLFLFVADLFRKPCPFQRCARHQRFTPVQRHATRTNRSQVTIPTTPECPTDDTTAQTGSPTEGPSHPYLQRWLRPDDAN